MAAIFMVASYPSLAQDDAVEIGRSSGFMRRRKQRTMACLIEFKTSRFDPAAEPPNRINPIAGQSVLKWLREHVVPDATEPDCEDWGWYMEVHFDGATYLIGAICHPPEQESADPIREWMIQIHKQRSLKDKLFGRNVLQPNDPLAAKIVGAFRADPAFLHIQQTTER